MSNQLSDIYYQIPNKSLGEFNIDNDHIYIQSLTNDAVDKSIIDTNFGKLAKLSAVPVATQNNIGGITLLTDSHKLIDTVIGGAEHQDDKQYAVQLQDQTNVAYVHVPWLNNTYAANTEDKVYKYSLDENGNVKKDSNGNLEKIYIDENNHSLGTCLTLDENDGTAILNDGITTKAPTTYISINKIPAEKLINIGDMVDISSRWSRYENVRKSITDPLSNEIDILEDALTQRIDDHIVSNIDDFNYLSNYISSVSNFVSTEIYLKSETSSNNEINNALTSLSNNFERYLNNTLKTNEETNPAYLKNQTSSKWELDEKFVSIQDNLIENYYNKNEVYNKNQTSCAEDLEKEFNTKQDNLNIVDNIVHAGKNYTNNDLATVDAIIKYVKERLNVGTATFQGQFNSWDTVYVDADKYFSEPNQNDYIYVTLNDVDVKKINAKTEYKNSPVSVGTWEFVMANNSWDKTLGKFNWKAVYKISDTLFTDTQADAINSGINKNKVSIYDRVQQDFDKLLNDFNNLSSRLKALAFKDQISNNIIGTDNCNDKQLAIFNGTDKTTGYKQLSSINFTPTVETWIFETYDGKEIKKKILTQPIN